jgi:mannosyl-oligosaccharide alpha-1,2-mannosidase
MTWDTSSGEPDMGSPIGIAAGADSHYEYLLKTWLVQSPKDQTYWDAWEAAIDDMLAKLVGDRQGGIFVGDSSNGRLQPDQQHLVCFLAGNVALGAQQTEQLDSSKVALYMKFAEQLAETCWQMYNISATGISPEIIVIDPNGQLQVPQGPQAVNLQRPEAVESWFYLWRYTKNPQYRQWGAAVLEAFNKHARVAAGYSGLVDVNRIPVQYDDVMESFWMAETLQYLYLLFSDDSVYPLDEWVWSTEAHIYRQPPPMPT